LVLFLLFPINNVSGLINLIERRHERRRGKREEGGRREKEGKERPKHRPSSYEHKKES